MVKIHSTTQFMLHKCKIVPSFRVTFYDLNEYISASFHFKKHNNVTIYLLTKIKTLPN